MGHRKRNGEQRKKLPVHAREEIKRIAMPSQQKDEKIDYNKICERLVQDAEKSGARAAGFNAAAIFLIVFAAVCGWIPLLASGTKGKAEKSRIEQTAQPAAVAGEQKTSPSAGGAPQAEDKAVQAEKSQDVDRFSRTILLVVAGLYCAATAVSRRKAQQRYRELSTRVFCLETLRAEANNNSEVVALYNKMRDRFFARMIADDDDYFTR